MALSCVTPTAADHQARFVVLLEPLPSGGIGRAVVDGVTIAKVNVSTGQEQWADVADGQTDYLQAGGAGSARILWLNDNSGVSWAIVQLGAGAGGAFPVVLQQDGGGPGDGSHACDYTYTITDLASGTELATDIDPTIAPHRYKRPPIGARIAATAGLAYWVLNAGQVVAAIYWCNEALDLDPCDPEAE
ncbi:MAG: hypothetical protein IT445_01105 [Phycisphaeraceae bacterium]|nr:hypothetical protein [Phycisphaeraceae bacterium]